MGMKYKWFPLRLLVKLTVNHVIPWNKVLWVFFTCSPNTEMNKDKYSTLSKPLKIAQVNYKRENLERQEGTFVYFKDVLVNKLNRKNNRSITSKQIINAWLILEDGCSMDTQSGKWNKKMRKRNLKSITTSV